MTLEHRGHQDETARLETSKTGHTRACTDPGACEVLSSDGLCPRIDVRALLMMFGRLCAGWTCVLRTDGQGRGQGGLRNISPDVRFIAYVRGRSNDLPGRL